MERLAGRIILLWGWKRAATAFLAGALLVLTQAPYDFFAAGFISFPILTWLLDGAATAPSSGMLRRLGVPFAIGWWFGLGYFIGGLWWIGNALLVEADSFAWALPLAVLGVPAILALFFGVATALARMFWSGGLGRIAALAFGFGVAEWARATLFTGFPWNAVGYAAMPMPLLMQSVTVVGVIGMNALAVFVFAAPGLLASLQHRRTGLALALLVSAAHAGYGALRLARPEAEGGKTLAVRIVQPSVDMSYKFDAAEEDRIFAGLLDLSVTAPAAGHGKPQLIVWPETSVPFLFTNRPDALSAIGAKLDAGQMLLAGAVRSEAAGQKADERYYNSIVAIDGDGAITDAVDKVHLVPFGEYLPFGDELKRLGLEQLVAGPMNFEAGTARPAIPLPGGMSAAGFVCYEIIFPDMVAIDAARADIVVNVTNDAWFGNSPGPYQHFRQAQVRAVETGLPVIRAANTGISGVIDSRGRIIDAFAIGARGHIDAQVRVPASSERPGLPSSRIGMAIIGFFGLIALLSAVRRRMISN